MRWLFSVFLSVAFAAGIYFFYQTWMDFQVGQAEIRFLQTEFAEYRKLEKQYQEREERVVVVNALWHEIEKVGLDPDAWVKYPFSVSRTLDWTEMNNLLLLSGNDLRKHGGYWFKPQRLRVSRVLLQPASQDGGLEDAPENAKFVEPQEGFETALTGTFMIQKVGD